MMSIILQILLNGVVIGGLYALTAIGLTTILGVMRITFLAHGAFYMLGAIFTYKLVTGLGLNFFPAALLAAGGIYVLGVLVEKFTIRPMRHDELKVMILTLSLAFIAEEVAKILWGPQYKNMPPYLMGNISLGGIGLEKQRLLAFVVAVVLVTAFLVFLKKTRMGKAIRMVAQDERAAMLLGINVDRIHAVTFGIGVALAASAAILLSPIYLIYPSMGWTPLMRSFAIVILGGMGSIEGTIAAGVIFGIIEMLTGYFLSPTLVTINIFLVLILVILFKPAGLFGTRVRQS